ncbi:PepSY-associated TM helix domain-containing protein [Azohydromonas aeria]|uniref:PepSY-associated TM helix domain-containing protein n=1 Tax=Azohydromonas aeria TaxID=2590212 RepID=UPI0012FB65AC|nr:PepSY-associated TM helix domain-containing protein [Azohydromonas aeria]
MTRKALRAAWLRLHRWLGLGLGAWLVLLGLSGSVLVFYVEIEPWFDARVAPRPAERPVSIEAVFQALQAAHPERGGGWRIELPAPGQALVTARYLKPQEREGHAFAPLLVSVDANTHEVVASRFWGETAMTWLYDLHYALLLDLPGRRAVALVGVALALSLLSGLWLWWPAPGRWRQALAFKREASAPRRVYDLHKWSGLLALPLLLVLGVTGSVLAWPQLHAPWVNLLGAPAAQRTPLSRSDPAGPRLPVDAVLAQVQAQFPQTQPRWIDVPGAAEPAAAYRLRVRWPGEPGDRFPAGVVWADARSGAVLAARVPAALRGADKFNQWLHPLHSGEAFGLAGRIVVFASGLLPLALAVTGLLRWGHKRRAAARQRQR